MPGERTVNDESIRAGFRSPPGRSPNGYEAQRGCCAADHGREQHHANNYHAKAFNQAFCAMFGESLEETFELTAM